MQNLILNRYRLLDVAGTGGYGTVQVAWDMRIQRRVAIKCLRLDAFGTAATPGTPRDVPGLDEARTAAMLSDPHIVGVYDFEVEGPMAYLIMEYMDGITLSELMRLAHGMLPLDVLTCVFESVAHAIEVAHDNQVLHLDIKPDNVLIDRQGRVKVADFGLAQLSHEAGFGKAAGGTIGYMPLEQMRLEAPDVRTDEWALAALTYQMLTGDNPFLAHDLAGAERAIEQAEIVIPSLARGDVGEEVDEAVFGALAIAREDRFASVTLFADAMMPHLGDARRGQRMLASIVGDACAEEEEEPEEEDATEPMPVVARARMGLGERLRGRAGAAVGRVLTAAACGVAAFAGASGAAGLPGVGDAGVAGQVVAAAAVALVAAAFPRVGSAAALALVAAALASRGAFPAAAVFAAAGLAWWAACGRRGGVQAAVGAAVPALSYAGLLPLAPLIAGACLRVRDAAASALFAVAAAFALEFGGAGSFSGGGLFVGAADALQALPLLADPSVWAQAASWPAAAVAAAALCARGGRVRACAGVLLATGVLVFGLMGRAFLESGMTSWAPDAADLAVLLAAGFAVASLVGWIGAPGRVFATRFDADDPAAVPSEAFAVSEGVDGPASRADSDAFDRRMP